MVVLLCHIIDLLNCCYFRLYELTVGPVQLLLSWLPFAVFGTETPVLSPV